MPVLIVRGPGISQPVEYPSGTRTDIILAAHLPNCALEAIGIAHMRMKEEMVSGGHYRVVPSNGACSAWLGILSCSHREYMLR